jgi:hypothetical protein
VSETTKTKSSERVKSGVSKKESLERLKNQYYQAETNGDTALKIKLKNIIKRIESLKDSP